jgi:hypothetical protein
MWFNPIMAGILRSPLHGLLSRSTVLITVRGRKSGRRITTPVNVIRRGDDLLTVSFRSRSWWRNVRGGAPVEVLLAGVERTGTAIVDEAEGDVSRGLAEAIAASPSLARVLRVGLEANGRTRPADLARAAQSRVVVRTRLSPAA